MSDSKIAVVFVNLGTPEEASPAGVRRFLRRFLSDPRVVDLPAILWKPLLNCIILPLRSRKVAKLYQQIWLKEGSPLKVISTRLCDKVAQQANQKYDTFLAMNYSHPDVGSVLEVVIKQGYKKLLLLPLYPQYSVTTTAPVYDAYFEACKKHYCLPELRVINHYYQDPAYITALAKSIQQHWQASEQAQVLIFSFHGIPERYANNGDPYPRHCETTAEKVALELGLSRQQWQLSYQSRFGKEPWLQPYTDQLLVNLAQQGIKSVDIISPAFATDCLETIEELGIELRSEFLDAGGERYSYIPALNDSQLQVDLMHKLIDRNIKDW